jgi:hypothetical protein
MAVTRTSTTICTSRQCTNPNSPTLPPKKIPTLGIVRLQQQISTTPPGSSLSRLYVSTPESWRLQIPLLPRRLAQAGHHHPHQVPPLVIPQSKEFLRLISHAGVKQSQPEPDTRSGLPPHTPNHSAPHEILKVAITPAGVVKHVCMCATFKARTLHVVCANALSTPWCSAIDKEGAQRCSPPGSRGCNAHASIQSIERM